MTTTTTRRAGMLVAMVVLAACGQEAKLQQLQISPVVTEVTENLQADVVATAVYSDGSKQDVTAQVAWSTVDAGVASAAAGKVQAGTPGRTYVVATYAGLQTAARVDVLAATLVSFQVGIDAASVPAGLTAKAYALGTFSDGSVRDVTASVQWSASGSIAVQPSGLIQAITAGYAMVHGAIGERVSAARIEVTAATVASLALQGLPAELPLGLTAPVQVLATFSDGLVLDVTEWTAFSTDDAAVAAVDAATLRGVSPGKTDLQASYGGLTLSRRVSVTEAAVLSIEVQAFDYLKQPVTAGQAAYLFYFKAFAHLTDGSAPEVTRDVTWTTDNAAIAVISNAIEPGAVLTMLPGTVTVTAQLKHGAAGSLVFEVAP